MVNWHARESFVQLHSRTSLLAWGQVMFAWRAPVSIIGTS